MCQTPYFLMVNENPTLEVLKNEADPGFFLFKLSKIH